ncbi:hypothetical protein R1flu_011164 [Riccia fluitans]|uniref:Uncharacterized protein n=1 Tax=Riccia fluitans TaxID=41844 RepID=A0ABD1ZB77_9MARC
MQQIDPDAELQRLNDIVYLAYDGNKEGRGGQIVFLHGIQSDHELDHDVHMRLSWSNKDGSQLWPNSWLSESFPTAAIYLVQYDSRMHQDDKHGRLDMFVTAEMILDNLLLAGIGQSRKNPVILIGQDIGGLVLKETCLRANSGARQDQRKMMFLQQLKGIFYFSTPNLGLDHKMHYWDPACQANEGDTGEQCGNSTFE